MTEKQGLEMRAAEAELYRELCKLCAGEVYHPKHMDGILASIENGNIFDDSISVRVQDSVREFDQGYLPTEKVTISFEYTQLRTDIGRVGFAKELLNRGDFDMTSDEKLKRLEHAKRQYLLRINDTPVAILVDDDYEEIVAGCFMCVERDGDIIDVLNGNPVNIVLGRITDEAALGYAHFMLAGIIEQIKLEKKEK